MWIRYAEKKEVDESWGMREFLGAPLTDLLCKKNLVVTG